MAIVVTLGLLVPWLRVVATVGGVAFVKEVVAIRVIFTGHHGEQTFPPCR